MRRDRLFKTTLQARASCSPVNVPFVEKEPLFGLGKIDVDIFVDAADDEEFVVIADGLGSEELFWLLERAFHAFDLSNLGVESEAVRDPTVVSSKDQDLRIIECEATNSISGRPVVLAVDKNDWLPLLLIQITIPVESLNSVERLFVLRVTSSNNIKMAAIKDTNRVVVSRLGKLSNLGPFVFGNFIYFAFLCCLVWVFRANSEQEILGSILKSLVKMGKLVS